MFLQKYYKNVVFALAISFLGFIVAFGYILSGRLNQWYEPTDKWATVAAYPAILAGRWIFLKMNFPLNIAFAVGLVVLLFQFVVIGFLISLVVFRKSKTPAETAEAAGPPTQIPPGTPQQPQQPVVTAPPPQASQQPSPPPASSQAPSGS